MMEQLTNETTIILPYASVTEKGNFDKAIVSINENFIDLVSDDVIYFRISAPELAAICAVMDFKIAEKIEQD